MLPDRSGWEPSIKTLLVHSQLDQETAIGRGTRLGRAISAQAALLREMGGGALAGMDDQAVVREALNTVGKAGKLGEQIRCVVSVSMLTEGWDAKCTHILGYRAFSTQLLCEQVVGRALRRSSYDVGEDGLLPPEFAEVLGVPFDFLPPASRHIAPQPEPRQTLRGQDAARQTGPPYRLPAHRLVPVRGGIGEPAARPGPSGAVRAGGCADDGCDGGRGRR